MDVQQELLRKLGEAFERLEEIRELIRSSGAEQLDVPIEPKRVSELMEQGICLQCGKKIGPKQRVIRGCHDSCYKRVMERIEAGDLTEQEAITAGQIAAKRITGRPKKTTAIDEYLATKAQSDQEINEHMQDVGRSLTRKKRAKKKSPPPKNSEK